jgi:hypothetical protein
LHRILTWGLLLIENSTLSFANLPIDKYSLAAKMAHPGNPLEKTHGPSLYTKESSESHVIAGIQITVYGLAELPKNISELAVLWLLHPRLQTQQSMAAFAFESIQHWNRQPKSKSKGLIAVSFDQRNHGSRQINALANEAWRQGNPRHAQDMFSSYRELTQFHRMPTARLTAKQRGPQLIPRFFSPIFHRICHRIYHCLASTWFSEYR